MINYRKPGKRLLEVSGEVERLGGDKPYVYILTQNRPRNVVRIETTEQNVKEFIGYLYQKVSAKFNKGFVSVKPLSPQ